MAEQKTVRTKTAKTKKMVAKIRAKRRKLTFRGRFGKKNIRRKSNPKWNKWRRPRGIDEQQKKEDGRTPQSGFRSPKSIRGIHPSGLNERLVRNEKEIAALKENEIARIASGIGNKKREKMCAEAEKKGTRVLNP
ncbi:MAG: eL32 family ribosomal protein [archaeon]